MISRKLFSTAFFQAPRRLETTVAKPRKNVEKMISMVDDFLEDTHRKGIFIPERVRTYEGNATVEIQGTNHKIIDFSKNSYMGFSNHPEVIDAGIQALKKYGAGIGCTRPGSGTYDIHTELENKLREFHMRDSSTHDTALLATGYSSNMGTIPVLVDERDAVLADQYSHGCIVDGIKLSKAQRNIFKHRDMEDLEKQLQDTQDKRFRLITTDGFYSMFGFCADLAKIRELADKYDAIIYLDDSHGLGVMGKEGRGTEDHQNIMGAADIITGSLSKGFTPQGGYVLARSQIAARVRQRSKPYVQSVALPVISTAMAIKSIDLSYQYGHAIRENIRKMSGKFYDAMMDVGFMVECERGLPAVVIVVPDDVYPDGHSMVMPFNEKLVQEHGVMVLSVVFPSSPPDRCRIRTSFAAYHTEADVDKLIDGFVKVGREMNIIK